MSLAPRARGAAGSSPARRTAGARPARRLRRWLAASALGLAAPAVLAAPDAGAQEYRARCAGCHGLSGAGDGPIARHLKKAPADLTTLARRNGGVFPRQRVLAAIDGRAEVGAHGPREMPVWGSVYRAQAMESGAGQRSAESAAQDRIETLVDYLEQLQRP